MIVQPAEKLRGQEMAMVPLNFFENTNIFLENFILFFYIPQRRVPSLPWFCHLLQSTGPWNLKLSKHQPLSLELAHIGLSVDSFDLIQIHVRVQTDPFN